MRHLTHYTKTGLVLLFLMFAIVYALIPLKEPELLASEYYKKRQFEKAYQTAINQSKRARKKGDFSQVLDCSAVLNKLNYRIGVGDPTETLRQLQLDSAAVVGGSYYLQAKYFYQLASSRFLSGDFCESARLFLKSYDLVLADTTKAALLEFGNPVLGGIARSYFNLGEIDGAEVYYQKTLWLYHQLGKEYEPYTWVNMAELCFEQGDFCNAVQFIQSGKENAVRYSNKRSYARLLRIDYSIDTTMGNYEIASYRLDTLTQIMEYLRKEEVHLITEKFRLSEELDRSRRKQREEWLIIIILVVVCILLYGFWRQEKTRKSIEFAMNSRSISNAAELYLFTEQYFPGLIDRLKTHELNFNEYQVQLLLCVLYGYTNGQTGEIISKSTSAARKGKLRLQDKVDSSLFSFVKKLAKRAK
jgi:tetratricopeptide (TPR) repeat protein